MITQQLTRAFEFDAAHRIMNEPVKCFNLHGHRFNVEFTFEYYTCSEIGYAIDFKELKDIIGGWIDEHLDHACILNPRDTELIELCKKNGWKLYVMNKGEDTAFKEHIQYLNPTAENLSMELLSIIDNLIDNVNIRLCKVRLYETEKCFVEVTNSVFNVED